MGGCVAKALGANKMPLILDAAGVGAGFLPGGDAVVAVAQMTVSAGGVVYSISHNDTAGGYLGGSAFVLSAATPMAKAVVKAFAEDAAEGVAETTGRAIARGIFDAIPGVGSLVSAAGFARDAYHTYRDYLACTEGGG